MSRDDRHQFLERIAESIASAGYHVTLVQGGSAPRFAYSIGAAELFESEIVLAGATSLTGTSVKRALDGAVEAARRDSLSIGACLDVPDVGRFHVGSVHATWARQMLLGAFDYYQRDGVVARQLIPEDSLRTIDVPDMSDPLDPAKEPIWRWLIETWTMGFSPSSVAVTDLAALHGKQISEAARWEEFEWEMFARAGPEVSRESVRVVPLATLLGFDPTLEPVTQLEVGKALRRVPPGAWAPWGR